jgi:hypothetical protein
MVAVAGGGSHSLAVKSDGTVWAWGANWSGQLGNGTNTSSNVPVQVTGLSGVVAVAGGGNHSLALKSDGTVWAWGSGLLGDGTTTNSNVPVQVTGLSGVVAVAGGVDHSLALKSDGTVWAWGYGLLGDGTTTNSNVPVQVTGLSGVVAVAAGWDHSLTVKSDGTVWAWGRNSLGQLGNGSNTDSNVPVQVTGLSDVVAVAAGDYHSMALKSDGTLWAWGWNIYGQLGNGSRTDSNVPVQVTGLSDLVAVAAGVYHSLALKSGGGSSCTYGISPTSANVGASGGSGTVSVSTQAGCSWTATSNASWITITSGASGSGNGTVTYSVAANTGAARTGTLTIAGQTFTVNQAAGGVSSSYSYWLPSASHAAGLNNSQWRTDLGILNLASSRNDVQLVFYGSSGQITQTTYVAAGSQSILVDVVGQMGASGNGALEVRTSLPAIVSSRTYNLNAAGASCYPNGTLGQNLDAFTAAEGLSTGQVGVLPQLTENSQYRTNIVLTNAGTSSATVKVELYDGSGAKVGEYTETLNAGEFKQKVQPFKSVANQTNLSRGYAKVTVVAGSGVMALASVVDNVTNDPTTVRMVRP